MPPLVTCDWLNKHLNDDSVKIIDASWYLPGADETSAASVFLQRHIPGAVFFDIDAIADPQSRLPHMAPPPEMFAHAVGHLGINNQDHVIVYDDQGIFSAARVWWTFQAMGHDRVSVLNGGLPAWQKSGFTLCHGQANQAAQPFKAQRRPELFVDADAVRANLTAQKPVLDARPAARFNGIAPEPRANLRRGHMPGAVNLPFCDLLSAAGHLKDAHHLQELFSQIGIDSDAQAASIITTCGSGITAAIINLALSVAGFTPGALYDGSWAEWGDEARAHERLLSDQLAFRVVIS